MDKAELKEKAVGALNFGVAAAKKLGDAACELGKEGMAAAKAKAQEMREAREAQKVKESVAPAAASDAPLVGLSGFETESTVSQVKKVESSRFDGAGDADDKRFTIRGVLLAGYWLFNIIYSIGCISWIASWAESWNMKDYAWVPVVVLVVLLLINRLWYEFTIAIFEIVKHLRQIRDELRKTNTRNIS